MCCPAFNSLPLFSRLHLESKDSNERQHIFEWLIFTEKRSVSMNYSIKKELTKSAITHFRAFYHSKMCCPAFNSLLSKCKRVGKSGKELNAGQHIFEWKIFTQKGVSLWNIHSKKNWYYDHKICKHSFQSGLLLEIVLSCVQLLKRVEIHSFTFREYCLPLASVGNGHFRVRSIYNGNWKHT